MILRAGKFWKTTTEVDQEGEWLQFIVYENKSLICPICACMGHFVNSLEKKATSVAQPKTKKVWHSEQATRATIIEEALVVDSEPTGYKRNRFWWIRGSCCCSWKPKEDPITPANVLTNIASKSPNQGEWITIKKRTKEVNQTTPTEAIDETQGMQMITSQADTDEDFIPETQAMGLIES